VSRPFPVVTPDGFDVGAAVANVLNTVILPRAGELRDMAIEFGKLAIDERKRQPASTLPASALPSAPVSGGHVPSPTRGVDDSPAQVAAPGTPIVSDAGPFNGLS
jgi:hypothetical protein